MDISENLLCLFSGQVEESGGSYVIEVPESELRFENIEEGLVYRVAVLPPLSRPENEVIKEPDGAGEPLEPPVEEGEIRVVDIENIGDQGDGITRVERGYVVIVPGADKGDRVRIEINQVRENVGFAEVIEELEYYE